MPNNNDLGSIVAETLKALPMSVAGYVNNQSPPALLGQLLGAASAVQPNNLGNSGMGALQALTQTAQQPNAWGSGVTSMGLAQPQQGQGNLQTPNVISHQDAAIAQINKQRKANAEEAHAQLGDEGLLKSAQQLDQQNAPQQQPQSINRISEPLSGMDILRGILPMLALPNMVKNSLQSQYGETPQGKLTSEIASAQQVPLTQAQEMSTAASMYSTQRQTIQDQLNAEIQNQKDRLSYMTTLASHPVASLLGAGTMNQIKKSISDGNDRIQGYQEQLKSLKIPKVLQKKFGVEQETKKSVGETYVGKLKSGMGYKVIKE